LLDIEKYIEFERDAIIRGCGLTYTDTGFLFISETSGEALTPNTITAEFSYLAEKAGLDDEACTHMMRHRYMVKLFIELTSQVKRDVDVIFRKRRVVLQRRAV
jgi:site-specific recombinase XerD